MTHLHGHVWTIAPFLLDRVRPPHLTPSVAFSVQLDDPQRGSLTLHGRLHVGSKDRLALVIHGLGGSPESDYVRRATADLSAAGASCLRLGLRGTAREGADIYHAGLTADLHAALASPALSHYRVIDVLGFSMGGHVALRFAAEPHDARVRAVAGICPPLDLAENQTQIDRGAFNVYRRHVLVGLKSIYRAADRRLAMATPYRKVAWVRRLHDWDALTVVPRFGFDSVETYYTQMSAGPVLNQVRVPTLVVVAEQDPMIPIESLRPFLEPAPDQVTVRITERGGHVAFPPDLDLQTGGGLGLGAGINAWFESV